VEALSQMNIRLDGDGYENTQSTTEAGDSTSTDSSGTDAVEGGILVPLKEPDKQ
jgi:hypothetical protein